ncbi:MAG TPA: adenylate/guanylate cyclase domain-containing protein [Candidatus Binatia bacterium]|nr:adenylate/guanylate cyclase domain-containing protein [Candidatus Binatia bacterium]
MDSPVLMVALVAIGMALSFWAADPASPTSRSLALTLGLYGLGLVVNVAGYAGVVDLSATLQSRIHSILAGGAILAGFEWIVRIGRTETARGPDAARPESLLRAAEALIVLHTALAVLNPDRMIQTFDPATDPRALERPAFYLFAIPFYLAILLAFARIIGLVRGEIDAAEHVRLIALCVAAPLLASGLFVPLSVQPFTTVAGELIFLGGAVRYHVAQGQRGQFLARFLSPQVAQLVRSRGLTTTMQQSRAQLSVVACDLRGFTSFTETNAPEDPLQVLNEYYVAIGAAVTQFGGTIKDFAGDGILILVGAPIAYDDHAIRAVEMAIDMRVRCEPLLARWRSLGMELGLGIGVASGFVTVGTIGGDAQLEYAAIGPPVNLASRLCARADDGQILVDQRTVGLLGDRSAHYRLEPLEAIELKGLAKPVPAYLLEPNESATELAIRRALDTVPARRIRRVIGALRGKV